MARFKEKASTFFFGLTVGLLIGCAFFIFKLDDYVRNIQFSDNNKPEFEETTDLREEVKQKKDQKKKNLVISDKKKDNAAAGSDSLSGDMAASSDSAGGLILDGGFVNDGDVSVLKEELVGVKNVKVRNGDGGTNTKDTLAASVAGVSESGGNEFLVIEFWKTPLNSKGYKMTRNKIVLYGIQDQNLDIVRVNDSYYLKNNNLVYRLSYSNEFRKMDRVSEPAVLARVN